MNIELDVAAILISAIVVVFQLILKWHLKKELEKVKKHHNRQLENLKSDLYIQKERLLLTEKGFQNKNFKTFERQMDVLEKMYKKLVRLNKASSKFARLLKTRSINKNEALEEDKEEYDEMVYAFNDAHQYLLDHKIFFVKGFADDLGKVLDDFYNRSYDIIDAQILDKKKYDVSKEERKNIHVKAYKARLNILRGEIPKQMEELEKEFRNALIIHD